VAFWAILSPGLSATLLSLWRRGFASGIRWGGLARAVNGIYLGTSQNPNWHHLSLPLALTVISFGLTFGRRQQMPKRSPDKHILLGLLLIVPTGSVLLLPERLTSRYLTPAFPASILLMGEAGKLVEWTGCRLVGWIKAHRPIHKLQSPTNLLQPVVDALLFAITCLLFAGVLIVNVNAYPAIYLPGGDSFRDKMAFLEAHAKPNDALLLHVSWQSLLLTYYDAGPFKTYTIPAGHFQAEQAKLDKALTEIFDTHDRVWVSYSFVEALDPEWLVSRWLHEHTHRVRSFQHLVLYHSAPSGNPFQETQEENSKRDGTTDWPNQLFLPLIMRNSGKKYTYADQAGVVFGDHLRLDGVAMANQFPAGGDAVLLYTRWVSIQDISQDVQLWLTLIGPNGETWAEHHSYIGPFMVSKGSWQTNETFVERSGLVVPISTPPGDYRLRVQVFTADGDEWLPENDVFEVGPVRVRHFLPADRLMQAIPNYGNFRANFGDKLALIGYEPGGLRFTSGNPLMFEIYWQALVTPSTEYKLSIEVIGDDKVLTNKLVHPVADWIPTNRWQDGDVLMGHHVVPLPIDASPGSYQVRLSVHTPSGTCLPVRGTYTSRVFNRWSRKQSFSGTSVALFDFTIEAPSHRYRIPAMQHHIDATLGSSKDQQDLRLLGYEFSSANVEPGDEFELTLYWKALSEMDRIYAAFIHLISPDNILVAQRDKWLGGGTYHTTHWVPREIVEEHYTVSVPQDISSGEYELRVGIYDAASGKQAVTMVDGAVVPGGYVLLQKVTVE
jgi:hypothetical protein